MAGEQLRVIGGTEDGKPLRVGSGLMIGREGPEEVGRLGGDPEISRRHAYLSRGVNGQLTIEDLGSANGTFVNDRRIDAPLALHPGDVVRLGKTVLLVTDRPSVSPTELAEPTAVPLVEPEQALLITAGPAQGRRLSPRDELVIGRGVSGAGRLHDDIQVSRRHARVIREASGGLSIEDVGSANGTFVNDERLHGRRLLKVGDSVRIGLSTLEVTDAGQEPASAGVAAPPLRTRSVPASASAPVPAPAPAPAGPEVPEAATGELASVLPPGSVFAGCRVDEVIGHGDMGVVYRAEELTLQRRVALKLILPSYSREERFRERFRRESRIAAAIDHPNVIPIFDAGEEDGMLFIVMRLVEGADLRSLIASEGPLEPRRAARIVRQVGAALDAAHARGMLHRDVKPSNVLLTGTDYVYLSDFGLAKEVAAAGGLTRQESIVARAEYVAPEQVLGQRVDARADVYALGCLLFEALTGEAPYAGWQQGPAALAHVTAPPASPLAVRREVPRECDVVVRRAMAKDPDARYPSAGDLGQAAVDAASGVRRARSWSVVATGEAAPPGDRRAEEVLHAESRGAMPDEAGARRLKALRWGIPLAGLLIVAVATSAATVGISSL